MTDLVTLFCLIAWFGLHLKVIVICAVGAGALAGILAIMARPPVNRRRYLSGKASVPAVTPNPWA